MDHPQTAGAAAELARLPQAQHGTMERFWLSHPSVSPEGRQRVPAPGRIGLHLAGRSARQEARRSARKPSSAPAPTSPA